MASVKPTHAQVPPQRRDVHESSLTQARVDALFRALSARREYEQGVARLVEATPDVLPPAQREAGE